MKRYSFYIRKETLEPGETPEFFTIEAKNNDEMLDQLFVIFAHTVEEIDEQD